MKTVAFALASVILAMLFSACTQRMICPAFQSAYIYDKEALRKKFSYFKEDSTPKVLTASKNRYLVITPKPYRQRLRSLQTIEMKDIYPSLDSVKADLLLTSDDSLAAVSEDLKPVEASDSVTRSFLTPDDSLSVGSTDLGLGETSDSVARVDSAYMITLEKEKYNVDQDMYMWYLRDILVLPDVRIALTPPEEKKKKGGKIGAFFRNLFGNLFKKRQGVDSTAVDSLRQEELAPLEDFMLSRQEEREEEVSSEDNERQEEVSSEDNEQQEASEAQEEKKRKRPKRKRQPKAKKRKNKKTEEIEETEQPTPETQD